MLHMTIQNSNFKAFVTYVTYSVLSTRNKNLMPADYQNPMSTLILHPSIRIQNIAIKLMLSHMEQLDSSQCGNA